MDGMNINGHATHVANAGVVSHAALSKLTKAEWLNQKGSLAKGGLISSISALVRARFQFLTEEDWEYLTQPYPSAEGIHEIREAANERRDETMTTNQTLKSRLLNSGLYSDTEAEYMLEKTVVKIVNNEWFRAITHTDDAAEIVTAAPEAPSEHPEAPEAPEAEIHAGNIELLNKLVNPQVPPVYELTTRLIEDLNTLPYIEREEGRTFGQRVSAARYRLSKTPGAKDWLKALNDARKDRSNRIKSIHIERHSVAPAMEKNSGVNDSIYQRGYNAGKNEQIEEAIKIRRQAEKIARETQIKIDKDLAKSESKQAEILEAMDKYGENVRDAHNRGYAKGVEDGSRLTPSPPPDTAYDPLVAKKLADIVATGMKKLIRMEAVRYREALSIQADKLTAEWSSASEINADKWIEAHTNWALDE